MNLEIRGLKELMTRLNDADGIAREELTRAMDKAVVVIHRRTSTYPPARPSSTYRRTRRLGNSWDMEVKQLHSDVQGIVDNPTEYGPYVMSPDKQAYMHKGRWATTAKIIEEQRQKVMGFFEYAVEQVVKRLG